MDDAITPTLDINFGLLKEVYYDPAFNAAMSDNNLYNVYWKDEMDEIVDKNSSIVTGWFHLTAKDISLVNFRHIYRFDFQNFRLNKIYDYNPLQDGLTKCEFIKIKTTVPFTSSTGSMTGGSNNSIGSVTVLPLPFPKPKGKKGINIGDTPMPIGNVISGKYNVVPRSATGIIITGDNNSIGENGRNVTILNSSGCVVAGDVSEVCIINSSGVTVTTNNTFVLNNITQNPIQGASQYWTASGNNIYNNNTNNVGIGAAVPGNKLTIESTSDDTLPALGANGGKFGLFKNTSYGFILGQRSNGSVFLQAQRIDGIPTAYEMLINPNGGDVSLGSGRFWGTSLHNNAGAVTGTTNQYIASGTYTATATSGSLVTATTSYTGQWTRVGNVVTVSGQFDATTNSTVGLANVTIALPIASTFGSFEQCGGGGATSAGTKPLYVKASGTSAYLRWFNDALTTETWGFSFTYLIL
jgi:hypothetical protein